MSNGDEFQIGWGNKTLTAKGLIVFVCLATIAIAGTNLYAGFRIEEKIREDGLHHRRAHLALKVAGDRTSCQVSLSPDERIQFRKAYTKESFRAWCPWVED